MDCGGYSDVGACDNCTRRTTTAVSTKECIKCKERPAQVHANQREPVCIPCLNASLYSKFKTAITTRDLILPSDKVLLGFSGGPSSRVALEFLLELRKKAQHDSSHNNATVFGLGAVYADERAVFHPVLSQGSVDDDLHEIVMTRSCKPDEFFITPVESVYSKNELDCIASASEKLRLLVESIEDPTGKEDLLHHLRMQALQKIASAKGYTKLALGVSSSRIAAEVIAATVKGHGFSLPADIQYYDARWNVPVILPLRDCSKKELTLLCHLRHLRTILTPSFSVMSLTKNSVNYLAASFVSLLQEGNPSRERTIVQTAAKLQPFSFNINENSKTSKVNPYSKAEAFCPVCVAPFSDEKDCDRDSQSFTGTSKGIQSCFRDKCCSSCQYQILSGSAHDETEKLLPELMKCSGVINPKVKEAWMRSQIKDFLLDDEADG